MMKSVTFRQMAVAVGATSLLAASDARADCYEFRPEQQSMSWDIVRNVRQGVTTPYEGQLNEYSTEYRLYFAKDDIWVGANEYLVVEMASTEFRPKVFINTGAILLAESWVRGTFDGTHVAEVHLAGPAASPGDGWVTVYFSTEEADRTGSYEGWVHRIERMQNVGDNYCNATFIRLQGGGQCDTCGQGPPPPPPDIRIDPPACECIEAGTGRRYDPMFGMDCDPGDEPTC